MKAFKYIFILVSVCCAVLGVAVSVRLHIFGVPALQFICALFPFVSGCAASIYFAHDIHKKLRTNQDQN